MKIAVIVGTRPEIIKMSPIIRELENRNADYYVIHTGQHYSNNMAGIFFEQLKLPKAMYNLEVGSGSHAEQTAKILVGIEQILIANKADIVLVQGDTNTVLSGALAAAKLHIKIGHVEAGLRSFDQRMPEEINRILTDHCSNYLFAPTEKAKANLVAEGISKSNIYLTGNTIVDALYQNLEIVEQTDNILKKFNIKPYKYFMATLHRQENVDDAKTFRSIIKGLDSVVTVFNLPGIFPIHPRSRKMLNEFGLKPKYLTLIEPLDFLGFLHLEKNARLTLTDSGGIQEESCILGVPCVTLRNNTERPETVDIGANILAGVNPKTILKCSEIMLGKDRCWQNPFGSGDAGKKIVSIVIGGNNG